MIYQQGTADERRRGEYHSHHATVSAAIKPVEGRREPFRSRGNDEVLKARGRASTAKLKVLTAHNEALVATAKRRWQGTPLLKVASGNAIALAQPSGFPVAAVINAVNESESGEYPSSAEEVMVQHSMHHYQPRRGG